MRFKQWGYTIKRKGGNPAVVERLSPTVLCPYCMDKLTPANAGLDHMIALARGGTNDAGNLIICCQACNRAKGIIHHAVFGEMLKKARELSPDGRDQYIILRKLRCGWRVQ